MKTLWRDAREIKLEFFFTGQNLLVFENINICEVRQVCFCYLVSAIHFSNCCAKFQHMLSLPMALPSLRESQQVAHPNSAEAAAKNSCKGKG